MISPVAATTRVPAGSAGLLTRVTAAQFRFFLECRGEQWLQPLRASLGRRRTGSSVVAFAIFHTGCDLPNLFHKIQPTPGGMEGERRPKGFVRTDLPRILLDVAHWVNRAMPQRASHGWALGTPSTASAANTIATVSRLHPVPPSVAAAVSELTSACTYPAELPFVAASEPPNADPLLASVVQSTVATIATVPAHPPASIPVSGAKHESGQLVWNDANNLCASDHDCVASMLPGAPGPLPVYTAPNVPRSSVEKPAFCLMCIRADAAAVCSVASKLAATSENSFGAVPVCLPPFQNLVGCADGYYPETLGVTPSQDVFSPVSIVGPNAPATVEYDAVTELWYIDQSKAVWRPHTPYLNGQAPAARPGSGWRSSAAQCAAPGPRFSLL